MKKILVISAISLSIYSVLAQPPVGQSSPDVPDTVGAKVDALYPVDTLGGGKQVPHDNHYSKGEGRVPNDSTRNRYANGGKPAQDKAHVKNHPAGKDTTHVHYKSSKTVKKTHKQNATTKTKKDNY